MNWKIPFFELKLGEEEKSAVNRVIESNWLTMGPCVSELEAAFAAAIGGDYHAVALTNCTAALHLSMICLGIGPGDEVLCPALTFVASANAARYVGASPIFVDICSESEWNLNPEDLERKITPKTRAVVAVHYGGYPCRMDAIMDLARKHNLRVVEDACHGPLAELHGKKLGTFGEFGCFSFFSNKNMTTGEGGMIITPDPHEAEALKSLRSHGMTSATFERFRGHTFGYDISALGFNYRIDELRSALGIAQLKKLPEINRMRKHLVGYYRDRLAETIPDVTIPFFNWDGNYGYHIFPILIPPRCDRNEIMANLRDRGIQTSIHYRPINTFSAFKDTNSELPITMAISERVLTLPLYPHLTEEQIDYVVSSLKDCL
jgi:dTDP-4-amino-4,6-dideoxygalactose transaminase